MCFGRLFQVIWNAVPVELEHGSNLSGTGVHLSGKKMFCDKTLFKGLFGVSQEVIVRRCFLKGQRTINAILFCHSLLIRVHTHASEATFKRLFACVRTKYRMPFLRITASSSS